ncbi:MAG: exodeoxyribonuclease large subunit [Acidobacteriota bacterium]|jgi:exodeoxyribonuclease VII large subunit|nr:exodeoxyribonuclease large subunit [Acidobacteriota bacterium]
MTHPLLLSLFDESERRPLSVTELTMQVRGTLEARFASVWVEGEISNFKMAASGHWYFTIKDESAQLHAKCFRGVNGRIRFRPSDGLQVRVRGRLSVYEPRGEYELIVEALDPVGAGALRVAFEQMRDRLAAEGLFDEELKQPLPLFPHRVGIVTSPNGAAIRDILTILARRTRTVNILFAPTRVQGEGAGQEIAQAVKLLNEFHERALADGRVDEMIDVIIVGRGGGSAEDLWAFNDEAVARALRASGVPVISAVGHETDVTISDFAADLRAPTPSAAAELVAAREDEIAAYVEALTRELLRSARSNIIAARLRAQEAAMSPAFDEVRERLHDALTSVDDAAHRLETLMMRAAQRARRRTDSVSRRLSPARLGARVSAAKVKFNVLCAARDAAASARLDDMRGRLAVAAASLDALSPLAVLKRGYAIASDERGKLLRVAREVQTGDAVRLRLSEGVLRCRVEEVENN